jgi:hypothetical protein
MAALIDLHASRISHRCADLFPQKGHRARQVTVRTGTTRSPLLNGRILGANTDETCLNGSPRLVHDCVTNAALAMSQMCAAGMHYT